MRPLLAVVLLIASACGGGPLSGGATPVPTPSVIVLPSFAQLDAPSANALWALVGGSRLFVSNDRGTHWSERSLPASVRYPVISFVDDRAGWLASASPDTPCVTGTRSLWQTTDGANTWHEVSFTGTSAATCAASLSFLHSEHGYLAALDPRSGPVVYATMDAGKSWSTSRPLSDPPDLPMQGGRADMELGKVRAFGTVLLFASRVRSGSIVPNQYVYSSSDGGMSWTYKATVPVTGALAFVTAERWLRLGAAGSSIESTDAGLTWHEFPTDYAQAAPSIPEMVFADAHVGYATVRGSIQRTVDGGAHWDQVETPGTR